MSGNASREPARPPRSGNAPTSKLLPNGEDQPLPLYTPDNPFVEETQAPVDAAPQAPSPEAIEAERVRVQTENIQMLNALAQQGMQFDPPLLVIQLKIRIDMLTELLIPSGAPMRPIFELQYEQQLHAILEDAVTNAARAKLLAK